VIKKVDKKAKKVDKTHDVLCPMWVGDIHTGHKCTKKIMHSGRHA
jgi:tRNA G26 N,N-dimethylase Trm1